MSKYLEQQMITASLVTPTWPTSGTRYIGLFTADPVDDPSVNAYELVASWYVREACGSWQAAQVSGTAATTSNQVAVTFPAVTGTTVTVTHFGVFDAASAGNMLYSGALNPTKSLSAGDVLTFAIGSLVLSFD
jgi:hypothetical protein